MMLSDDHKRSLLCMARQAIYRHLGPTILNKGPDIGTDDAGQIKCGVFVSLYVEGRLRGCIGTFSEANILTDNVKNMALSSSTSDSRFSPIQPSELDSLKIELSVLSPRKQISDKNEIILGRHGIYMEKDNRRGTFLPQVATEQNWSIDEFLGNCARHKAKIGWNGWKEAKLYTYEAIVFSSDDFPEEN